MPYKNIRRGVYRARSAMGTDSFNILAIGIVAGVGFLGYKVYDKFFGESDFSKAQSEADKAGDVHLTTRNASEGTGLDALRAQLASQGFQVSSQHLGLANTLNGYLDRASVDHDAVVNTIKGMSLQTFQLTAIAYGQRELRNYRNSVLHVLNPDTWSDLFSDKKLYGTLKYHLTTVLTSAELRSISAKVNTIP